MRRLVALAALVLLVAAWSAYEAGDLRAPWSGVTVAAQGVALFALGAALRGWGLLLAPVAAAAIVGVTYRNGTWGAIEQEPGCDPSCGISTPAGMLVAATVALLLAVAGALADLAVRRLRGRAQQRTGMTPSRSR